MPIVGTQQSPIRIEDASAIKVPSGFDRLLIGYDRDLPGKFKGDNFVFDLPAPSPDGTRCEAKPADVAGKTVNFGRETWILRKIHIHKPAEHLFEEDEPFPYECHLLHSLPGDVHARGVKLVIATFFDIATARHKPTGKKLAAMKNADRSTLIALNQAIKDFVPSEDEPDPCKAAHPTQINPLHFLPAENLRHRWYHYQGSLTTAPFTEDVTWFVMPDESFIESEQIHMIGQSARQEPRATHPLDRRFVLKSF